MRYYIRWKNIFTVAPASMIDDYINYLMLVGASREDIQIEVDAESWTVAQRKVKSSTSPVPS